MNDMLGANLYGIPVLLVQPHAAGHQSDHTPGNARLKKPVLARYYKKAGVHGKEEDCKSTGRIEASRPPILE